MFEIFKKWKVAQPSSAEVVTQSNAATEALKDKWFDFNQQLKFKEEGRGLEKTPLRSVEQFIGTMKGQNFFLNRILF